MVDCAGAHAATVNAIAQEAAAVESAWLQADAQNAAKAEEHKSMEVQKGDYRAMGWNTSGWVDRKTCRRCGEGCVKSQSVTAGCRMNGDGYGTLISACGKCGLVLWRSYDDHD